MMDALIVSIQMVLVRRIIHPAKPYMYSLVLENKPTSIYSHLTRNEKWKLWVGWHGSLSQDHRRGQTCHVIYGIPMQDHKILQKTESSFPLKVYATWGFSTGDKSWSYSYSYPWNCSWARITISNHTPQYFISRPLSLIIFQLSETYIISSFRAWASKAPQCRQGRLAYGIVSMCVVCCVLCCL